MRTPAAAMLQRREVTDGTFDAPHKVTLGEVRLLPGIKPRRHNFIPEKRVKKPLANGSFEVAGIPVGYELTTDAHLKSGVGFQSGPAMLTDIELIARGAEAERLRSRPTLIPGLPLGGPPPGPRGELEGMARLRFSAVASLDASAKATLSGGINALSKAVSVGAYGGFGGSAKATARLNVDNVVFLTWKDGAISLRSDTVPGFWLGFDLEFAISAEAGVYVELRVPEIPVFTSLYDEIESWPGVGWFLPNLKKLHWRQEYGKTWQLAVKKYRHNLPLDLAIGKAIEPVVTPVNGPSPDEMLNDAGQKQKEQLKDDPVGPGEKLKSDPGALAAAEAAARAQLGSTREIINREKSVTAKLLSDARRSAVKPTSASTGGVQMAGVDLPGGGGPDDDTPVEQLKRRKDALDDADAKCKRLETGRVGHADPDSGG